VRTPSYTGSFRRDMKRVERRGKDMTKLRAVVKLLIEEEPLPATLKDHPLKGEWRGWRELHIDPDWLLVYQIEGQNVRFDRTGTHSDLFKK
jgi:mRNA interferase YafQ